MSNIERLCEQLQQLFDAKQRLCAKNSDSITANEFERLLIAANSVRYDVFNRNALIKQNYRQIEMLRDLVKLAMPHLAGTDEELKA